MIKHSIEGLGLAPFAVIGLTIFVAVFCGIVAWTLTRKNRQVEAWARLPLGDRDEPTDPLN